MTAMINQEALAKAIKPLVWVHMGDGPRCITVCGMYAIHQSSGPYGTPMLTLTGMPGNLFGKFTTLDEAKAAAQADYVARILSALNIEALPHVDRAGVLVGYTRPDYLDSLAKCGPPPGYVNLTVTTEPTKHAILALYALAQPAVNTSPEGVGGTRSEPVEVEPTDPYAELVAFFNEPAAYAKWGLQGDYDGLRPVETAVRALRDVLASPTDERSK